MRKRCIDERLFSDGVVFLFSYEALVGFLLWVKEFEINLKGEDNLVYGCSEITYERINKDDFQLGQYGIKKFSVLLGTPEHYAYEVAINDGYDMDLSYCLGIISENRNIFLISDRCELLTRTENVISLIRAKDYVSKRVMA